MTPFRKKVHFVSSFRYNKTGTTIDVPTLNSPNNLFGWVVVSKEIMVSLESWSRYTHRRFVDTIDRHKVHMHAACGGDVRDVVGGDII